MCGNRRVVGGYDARMSLCKYIKGGGIVATFWKHFCGTKHSAEVRLVPFKKLG